MASEPLDGKQLAALRRLFADAGPSHMVNGLLALVDELREALLWTYQHTQPDWVEQHAAHIGGYMTVNNRVAELLARIAPPSEPPNE